MNNVKKSRRPGGAAPSSSKLVRLVGARLREAGTAIFGKIQSVSPSEKTLRRIRTFLAAVFTFFEAFILGRCGFDIGVYPLGLAFLIASERYTFFAYMGSAVAALTYPYLALSFFGVNSLIYIIRKILLSDDHSESTRTRVLTGVFCGIFISGALFLSNSALTQSALHRYGRFDLILVCVVYCFIIPLAAYLFYPMLSRSSFGKKRTAVSLVFLCAITIHAIPYTLIFGMGFSHFAACFLTLFFCLSSERAVSCLCGVLFGAFCGNISFGVCLCLAAFAFTYVYPKHRITAYPVFAAVAVFSMMCFTDFTVYSPTIIPFTLSAVAIFFPIGLLIGAGSALSGMNENPTTDAAIEAYTRRMADLSGAFGAVSKLCYSFAGRFRLPSEDEVQVVIALESSKVCTECEKCGKCRKKQLWCNSGLAACLCDGKLSPSMLPEQLKSSCNRYDVILDGINSEYSRLLSERFTNNKTEILAREYAGIAKLLKYTSRMTARDLHFDPVLTEKASRAAEKLGLPNKSVTVCGRRRKVLDITGVPVSSVTETSGELAAFFSRECEALFDVPEFILEENGSFTLRFTSKQRIAAEYAKASHTKCGETVCGDTVSFFESNDGFLYALIADGMGSGRDAAMTSKMTAVFIEKLLSGGAGKGVTMELLNSVLMSKSRECFSGVDLLELDLILRRASFVKAGAAPAYLLRAKKLFKVSSDTPPCGIIEAFCAENTSFEVFPGDTVIMMSDGITSAIDCSKALCDILSSRKNAPISLIADEIIRLASNAAVHDDDMSCIIVRIKS